MAGLGADLRRWIRCLTRRCSPTAPTQTPAGKQVSIVSAALQGVLPDKLLACSPRLLVYVEVCSTHEHPPPDRVTCRRLLAAVRPGDWVVLADPSRAARSPEHLLAVLEALTGRGAVVAVAAVGPDAASPLAILAVPCSLAQQLRPEQLQAVQRVCAAVMAAAAAAWALSVQHGVYPAEQALLQRVAATGLPASDPRSVVLAAVCRRRPAVIFVRVSDPTLLGGAQAGAGAAAGGSLSAPSLQRQQSVITRVLNATECVPAAVWLPPARPCLFPASPRRA